ncbi:hypothetical protein B0H34DRAFT_54494 [Crassisporium funariophilum]|nr:hypothetical protein B0H34DRAFT_54494 [Crassisporium funariophilum]
MASSTKSISTAVARTITFLTEKLAESHSANTVLKLRMLLEANLTAHYAPSWNPDEPIRGSGRRCMTLSPNSLPPRPIWAACAATNVQWFSWIRLLGDTEFDLFVDPGCVAIRVENQIFTVWSDASVAQPVMQTPPPSQQKPITSGKTFAQQIINEDLEEDDHIFTLLADEMSAPTWMTPILTQFPMPTRSASPLSSISEHSRCSSRSSSSSSSAFSFVSADTSSSRTSLSASACSSKGSVDVKQSRRERARQARVFVDTTKTDVTPYDGGKTTVLTGGVMLGGGPKAVKPKKMANQDAMMTTNSWRSVRA